MTNAFTGIVVGGGVGFFVGTLAAAIPASDNGNNPADFLKIALPAGGTCAGSYLGYLAATM